MHLSCYQSPLSKEEKELIHEKTLYLLENNGSIFQNDEAIEIFKKHGFRTDGYRVFFTPKQVEACLATVPKTFDYVGRDSSVTIGDGETKVFPALGPMYVLEDGKYHLATMKDYKDFTVMCATSDIVDFVNVPMMRPIDLPITSMENIKMRTAIALASTTKPVQLSAEGTQAIEETLEMVRQFYGLDEKTDKYYGYSSISTAAPFVLTGESCESLIVLAKAGQIVKVNGSGMPGMTAPPTIAGMTLQSNAERVVGLMLPQLINPGIPHMMGGAAFSTDLRYSACVSGTPESVLRTICDTEMAAFYGIPFVSASMALPDSKDLDYQCGVESFMTTYPIMTAKPACVQHYGGVLDSYNSLSLDKFVLDEDMFRYAKKLTKPVDFSEKSLCVDRIMKAQPGGNYIGRTEKAYREEFTLPKLFMTMGHGEWESAGCEKLQSRSKQAYTKRLESFKPTEFDSVQKQIIEDNVPVDYRF